MELVVWMPAETFLLTTTNEGEKNNLERRKEPNRKIWSKDILREHHTPIQTMRKKEKKKTIGFPDKWIKVKDNCQVFILFHGFKVRTDQPKSTARKLCKFFREETPTSRLENFRQEKQRGDIRRRRIREHFSLGYPVDKIRK